MAAWGGGNKSAEGILRSAGSANVKEELLVFGYSCKLFRDDERAREVDQGKLLIPWGGDESLRIDRYDARGALHELASLEAPPGGHDWRLELTDAERRVEQLCDEERYRALYCDEDEELMYKEEELKRLHTAGYGQIAFNYDSETTQAPPAPPAEPAETDEPFTPSPQLRALLPPDIVLPDTQKLNAIVEKTATFIARQGVQMEILLRAKQAGNAQFDFLDKGRPLHRYYQLLLDAVRTNKYNTQPEKGPEVKPEEEHEDYLHPSLAAPVIESAPLIPSIHYKPSADCDYTMLISRIRGTCGREEEEAPEPVPAGELAPPGTQPLTLPADQLGDPNARYYQHASYAIARAPVLYTQPSADLQQQPPQIVQSSPPTAAVPDTLHVEPPAAPIVLDMERAPPDAAANAPAAKSAGLNLMHYYNSASDSEHSDSETETETSRPASPPPDVRLIIDKMAAYVARNGDEFQEIVKAKRDPRFTFLDSQHPHHAYYLRLMLDKRGGGGVPPSAAPFAPPSRPPDSRHRDDKKATIAPVSFSIKKLKEPEPILPKPALPYESSSDDDKETAESDPKPADTALITEPSQILVPPVTPTTPTEIITSQTHIPQSFIYKVDAINTDEKPTLFNPPPENLHPRDTKNTEDKQKTEEVLKKAEEKTDRKRKAESKKKPRENGESKSKRERRKSRGSDRSRDRAKSRSKEKEKSGDRTQVSGSRERSKERSESKESKIEKPEIITVADRSEDELIDLTGDLSDGKGDGDSNGDRTKQIERKRRAAAFLAAVGRDVTAVAPPPVVQDNTLACAMVKTLEGLRAKKEAAERRRARRAEREKRSRNRRAHKPKEEQESGREREREKSHHKSKRRKRSSTIEEQEDEYYSSSRRKKHKSDKKHSSSSSKKQKRTKESSRESSETQVTPPRRRGTTQKETSKKDKEDSSMEENGAKTTEIDVAAIKSKLKMLREESEEELEARRWRAESPESEKKKKEYSEGEWETSEEEHSSSSSTATE